MGTQNKRRTLSIWHASTLVRKQHHHDNSSINTPCAARAPGPEKRDTRQHEQIEHRCTPHPPASRERDVQRCYIHKIASNIKTVHTYTNTKQVKKSNGYDGGMGASRKVIIFKHVGNKKNIGMNEKYFTKINYPPSPLLNHYPYPHPINAVGVMQCCWSMHVFGNASLNVFICSCTM